MNTVAMLIGYGVMIPVAFIAVLLPVWVATGYAGKTLYKRLRRVYSLQVVWYWLRRLETEGKRCFEKAEDEKGGM